MMAFLRSESQCGAENLPWQKVRSLSVHVSRIFSQACLIVSTLVWIISEINACCISYVKESLPSLFLFVWPVMFDPGVQPKPFGSLLKPWHE